MLKNKKIQIIAIVLVISIIGGIAYNMNSNKNDQKIEGEKIDITNSTGEFSPDDITYCEEEGCAGHSLLNSSGID